MPRRPSLAIAAGYRPGGTHRPGEPGARPARTGARSRCPLQSSRRPAGTVTVVVFLSSSCVRCPAWLICGCWESLGEPHPASAWCPMSAYLGPGAPPTPAQPQACAVSHRLSMCPPTLWLQEVRNPFSAPPLVIPLFRLEGGPSLQKPDIWGALPSRGHGRTAAGTPWNGAFGSENQPCRSCALPGLSCVWVPGRLARLWGQGAPSAPCSPVCL